MVKTAKASSGKSAKVKHESKHLADLIVSGMQEKKANDIVCLDLRKLKNAVTDYFIICHAESRTHIEAIAGAVEEFVQRKNDELPYHREGFENAEWILLDYINVVAHIFNREKREFYNIERLWADADIKKIAENY